MSPTTNSNNRSSSSTRDNQPYHRISNSISSIQHPLPSSPPTYDELVDSNTTTTGNTGNTPPIEQFEIDDSYFDYDTHQLHPQSRILIIYNFINNNIINPINKLIEPIYEGYKYFQLQYEKSILKLGNPLVVKRLLYVTFIMTLIFFISKYNTNDSIKGSSGGGGSSFNTGKLYNINKLQDAIHNYIDPELMKDNLQYFSSISHISGTKGDLTLAKYIEQSMKNNGIHNVEFNELQSLINYPSKNPDDTYIKLSDGSFTAKLYESDGSKLENFAFMPNSLNTEEINLKYIYLNYGLHQDYKSLDSNNINYRDKIALIKYGGGIPESNKVKLAQSKGIKAIIFISPKFNIPFSYMETIEHDDVIIRENVGLTRISPGDVLTPGWSSEDGYITRLSWEKSQTTPKIPTIPISNKDGQALIKKLGNNKGFKFPDGTYSGNDESDLTIQLKITNTIRELHPIWNVIGSIEGREQNDKAVIIGANRDSLCDGTIANGGSIVLLELIKIFTSLQRKFQWSPTRSIYFISFDGGEYNLAGSSEWIENRREILSKQGYLYIDLSDLVSGDKLQINAHPFLQGVIKGEFSKFRSGELYELFHNSYHGDLKELTIDNNFMEFKNYLPFINLLNIPSLEIKFVGDETYPKNSCFDDMSYFKYSHGDSSNSRMTKHAQIVELLARVILKFAEDPLIPYSFEELSNSLDHSIKDLQSYAQSSHSQLNFEPLFKANSILKDNGQKYEKWRFEWTRFIANSNGAEPSLYALTRWKWNENMLVFNNKFLRPFITPQSSHQGSELVRPGYLNRLFGMGYGTPLNDKTHEWNTFPEIREMIRMGADGGKIQNEINSLANTFAEAAREFLNLNS
ncbi:uncharacterized protein J8A68_000946 [[Candida] subhashii]|uniref:Uncharacterized protein n=1 Tax=[Candida] subhashii TaxID=561895 RepID=A0A8J5QQH0_9ASCO|nr:uncharacterized protein J8A68_000946 [[Candida] subhashii]KAG7665544.1 hypothetical protein J8A68_000946 [[Candida] subhashii]